MGCKIYDLSKEKKVKPEWLLKAETMKPTEFIEWMHKNKSYKKDSEKGYEKKNSRVDM